MMPKIDALMNAFRIMEGRKLLLAVYGSDDIQLLFETLGDEYNLITIEPSGNILLGFDLWTEDSRIQAELADRESGLLG